MKVLEVGEDFLVAGDEAAQRTEALGEGAHDEVGLLRQAEVAGGAGAILSDHAETVGVVDHDGSPVFPGQAHDVGQRGDVAFHRVDAVHHDELRSVLRGQEELAFQGAHVVVGELAHLAETQTAAVDDAGVVQGVQEDVAAAETEATHDAQVHLESGAVGHGFFLAHELRQFLFQLLVDVEGTVEETAAGAAGAIFLYCFDCGLLEAGVIG